MGESTLLSGKVQDLGMDEIRIDTQVGPVSVEAAGEPGFDVSLAIRPEHITLAPQRPPSRSAKPRWSMSSSRAASSACSAVSIKNPDVTFIAKVRSNQPVAVGDTVELHAAPADMILLSR